MLRATWAWKHDCCTGGREGRLRREGKKSPVLEELPLSDCGRGVSFSSRPLLTKIINERSTTANYLSIKLAQADPTQGGLVVRIIITTGIAAGLIKFGLMEIEILVVTKLICVQIFLLQLGHVCCLKCCSVIKEIPGPT